MQHAVVHVIACGSVFTTHLLWLVLDCRETIFTVDCHGRSGDPCINLQQRFETHGLRTCPLCTTLATRSQDKWKRIIIKISNLEGRLNILAGAEGQTIRCVRGNWEKNKGAEMQGMSLQCHSYQPHELKF